MMKPPVYNAPPPHWNLEGANYNFTNTQLASFNLGGGGYIELGPLNVSWVIIITFL